MKDKALNLLFEKQMQSFTLAKEKYDNLKNVICKDIPNGVYTLRVQHNPARMTPPMPVSISYASEPGLFLV